MERCYAHFCISAWGLEARVQSVTSDKAADVVKGVTLLFKGLKNAYPGKYEDISTLNIRCVFHAIIFAVEESRKMMVEQVSRIRSMRNSLQASVKRMDLFYLVFREFDLNVDLPGIDCEIRWSATFFMIHKAFKARLTITAVVQRIPDVAHLFMTENNWFKAHHKGKEFLEQFAAVTTNKSRRQYVTLGL